MGTTTTGYTLIKAKTPVVAWGPLWHIVVVSAAAGCGLAIAFGLILYGTEIAAMAKHEAGKVSGWLLSLLAAAFCIAAIGAGVYAMTHPGKSKPNQVVPSRSASD
jgi:hypothetical protein